MPIDLDNPWTIWEQRFADFIDNEAGNDVAHDRAHIQRVVANARKLAREENAQLAIVIPAAWLHDCVTMHKDSDKRSKASRMAGAKAARFLKESGYAEEQIPAIEHAIAAHSFTAQIKPQTVEAKVVQDADRLDAIGAIGIARCFTVGGILGTRLYDPVEPFPEKRQADDRQNTIDHFFVKLLTLADTMQTSAGKAEAIKRTEFMQRFLKQFQEEIQV